jgi:hypothetical protein
MLLFVSLLRSVVVFLAHLMKAATGEKGNAVIAADNTHQTEQAARSTEHAAF